MAAQLMAPQLKAQIDDHYVRQGPLFGAVPAHVLDLEQQRDLEDRGWAVREYLNQTVLTAPQATVRWDQHLFRFRDGILHHAAHQLAEGVPVAGNAQAIVDEVIDSVWDARLDQLRTVWGAFAYAALREGDPTPGGDPEAITPASFAMEDQETYFFYTQAMADAAVATLAEVVKPPDREDDLWAMLAAIHDAP